MKTTLGILFLLLFSGCVGGAAFLGPAITVANTGNIYQAGLSYGSNKAIKKITGKTPIENIQTMLTPKKNDIKIISSLKSKIEKSAKIKNLSNQ